jgi:hypothetical protein
MQNCARRQGEQALRWRAAPSGAAGANRQAHLKPKIDSRYLLSSSTPMLLPYLRGAAGEQREEVVTSGWLAQVAGYCTRQKGNGGGGGGKTRVQGRTPRAAADCLPPSRSAHHDRMTAAVVKEPVILLAAMQPPS